MHVWQTIPKVMHRQVRRRVRPILEHLAIPLGLVKLAVLKRRQPGPERMLVSPFNHRDRINLDVTQLVDAAKHPGLGSPERISPVQTLAHHHQSPCLRSGQLNHRVGAHALATQRINGIRQVHFCQSLDRSLVSREHP